VSWRRLAAICLFDLRENTRRPLLWIWISLTALLGMLMGAGVLRIHSGEDMAGGIQTHITSQFSNAYEMSIFAAILFPLFVTVVAGMGVLRDGELRVEALIHSTPLRPAEYVWGKFLAAVVTSFTVLAVQVGLVMLFKHGMTAAENPELVGDFVLANYLVPVFFLTIPLILFVAGTTFAIGEGTRNAVLVNMVPLVLLLASVFFLWTWSPLWLDPRWNRFLMLIEPAGFRWVNETWLKVDRGAAFYNSARIAFDPAFVASRLAFVAVGILAVIRAKRHLASSIRGERVGAAEVECALADQEQQTAQPAVSSSRLANLSMSSRPRGLVRDVLEVARVEVAVLGRHPAMWILIPLVVLNATVDAIFAVGPLDMPLLLTPGVSAVGSLVELTFTLCLLLMFYAVESLRRERVTRIDGMYYATPMKTSALILGKSLAASAVGFVAMFAVVATCAVLLLLQGTVPLDPTPYLIVYGFLVGPIVLFWCAFVSLVYSVTGSRFTTYAISIAAMIGSGILTMTNKMTWVWNWSLSGALRWSDIAPFELNRTPLVLNRLLVLSVAVLFLVVAFRLFPRRRFDHARVMMRLQPAVLVRSLLRLAPLMLIPLVLGVTLHKGINRGPQGGRIERWSKHYWQRNHATWLDAAVPDVVHSEIDLELEPERRWFRTRGSYKLVNSTEGLLDRIPITGGPHWEDLSWTLNGQPYGPEDRQGLFIFTPPTDLAPGASCTVGFEFEGVFLGGFSRNGEGSSEFILPSGVVLTATGPSFVPVVGYLESIGVTEDNAYDSKDYPDDFYEGVTGAAFGPDAPQTTRVRITAPEKYTMNSVGVLTESVVADGKRTVTWESDHPLDTFNVVGGLWDLRRGEGTAIYYHPAHHYHIDEMLVALDGARRYYSEWFHPFPWRELKVSEFPAEANYAQGFVTNITFSESMGFLVKENSRVNAPFLVTAHEAAHQWWGGLLMPGEGPNGNILSEGTAHFSTMLLFEELRGTGQRIEFCKWLEDRYNRRRVVNSERELVKIDGSRKGDTAVVYDKGSWVFWMLMQHMGRESNLEAIRSFISHYIQDRDHPVLQDFVAHLRPFAADPETFDAFVDQWFYNVVLPEYVLTKVEREPVDDEGGSWEVRLDVRNAGTGRMPVEIAIERGLRFPVGEAGSETEPFQDARVTVDLGGGESQEVRVICNFEPQRVLIDPDAKVLQRGRKFAIHRF